MAMSLCALTRLHLAPSPRIATRLGCGIMGIGPTRVRLLGQVDVRIQGRVRVSPRVSVRFYSTGDGEDGLRPCIAGTWYISRPERTDPGSVVSSLPKLGVVDRTRLRHALFLVTPGLAAWFEERSGFLAEVMTRLYGVEAHEASKEGNGQGHGPVSFIGVVDGLPAQEGLKGLEVKQRGLCEGVAICLLPRVDCREREAEFQDRNALLRVRSNMADGTGTSGDHLFRKGDVVSLTFPFANTLFTNGRYNTVFKISWGKSESKRSLIPKESPVPVDGIQFTWPEPPETFLNFDAPLYALTARREVLSSMGNVVREVKGDKGESLKASLELEAIVPKFLVQHNVDGSTIQLQVFARIMPPEQSTGSSDDVPVNAMVNEKWPYSTLLGEGHMYRVMSGGGGWGKKAGLLSLNPATNFDPPRKSEPSIFPDPDADEVDFKGAAELGALVPVGYTIQFFAAKIDSSRPAKTDAIGRYKQSNSHKLLNSSERWGQTPSRLVFGNVQAQDSVATQSIDDDTKSHLPILVKDQFSALFEGGAALALLHQESTNSINKNPPTIDSNMHSTNEFKIDAPNATFRSMLTAGSH